MTTFARVLSAVAFTACSVAFAARAAENAKPAPKVACSAPEHRQFDFWIGEWEVRNPADKVVGRNRIAAVHKGCALFENWAGDGGFTGSSLNIYDADRRKWHQTWVDNSGGLLQLEGGLVDGRMVLQGDARDAARPGVVTINRITWQPLADGRVRQLWEASTDKGTTWKTVFDGFYKKQR